MVDLSISEKLMYSTVRIESRLANGGISTGTGFFYRMLNDVETNTHVPVIVTNKHVIDGSISGRFVVNLADSDGNPIHRDQESFEISDFEKCWIKHPESDVDLCIMPISLLVNEAVSRNKKLFYINLDSDLIPTEEQMKEYDAMENVIMIGYPNGIWDKVNNLPIMRRGITATHPTFNYNGKEEFLIDAAVFPGSSGSPIILLNIGGFTDKNGNTNLGSSRLKLLGVLYAVYQHNTQGDVQVIEVPTRQQAIAISAVPNNLGIVIKSQKLLDFEPILKSMMQQ